MIPRHQPTSLPNGFTTIELVVVIVVLGVVAVSILPRLNAGSEFKAAGYREELVAALRYAQKSAASHRRLVCAQISGSGLTLRIADTNPAPAGNCGSTPLAGLSGANSDIANTGGFATVATQAALFFQPSGKVTNLGGTPFGTVTITVTGQSPILIEGQTGYVGGG